MAQISAMTSPIRARWRRRWRAWCWGCRRSRCPSSRARARWTTASTAASALTWQRALWRRWWSASTRCRFRSGLCSTSTCQRLGRGGGGGAGFGRRIYRDELKLDSEEDEGRRYWIYGSDPGFHDEPGTDLAAVAAGRIAGAAHPLLTHPPPRPASRPGGV